MNTKQFRTKQEFTKRVTHPKGKDYIIGLDAGYSGMKVFYENGYFCFPSYVRKLEETLIASDEKDILYKDMETGELYLIGQTAQNMISTIETNDTDSELYSRKRYKNKKFQILCSAAIGIACMSADLKNRKIIVQTGLPSSYVTADAKLMVSALCEPAHFKIKIGHQDWVECNVALEKDNVFSDMAQPAGSLYSVLIGDDGKYVPNAKEYLYGNTLVMDIGFGTFDFFAIKNHAVSCRESIDDIGMRQVLKETSKKIMSEMNEEIRVPAFQKILETGKVVCIDEDEMKMEEKSISGLLETASEEVFRQAMQQAKEVTSVFRDYQNLIIAGGTGAAWCNKIKEYLAGMKYLRIVESNINDHLPMIYSNARGYYMFRYSVNKK